MPAALLLLRHGQSTWNAEGRWQGWSDPPLSDLGRAQAEEAATRLAGVGAGAVVSSDLLRARDTAATVARVLGLPAPREDPDLREYDVGDWEGLTRPQIERGWPDQLAAWSEGRLLATPGGETRASFVNRVMTGLRRVAVGDGVGGDGVGGDGVVVVVTHGGAIRAAEQVTGTRRSQAIGNLAGRWFLAGADGALTAGELTNLLDPAHRTTPPSA